MRFIKEKDKKQIDRLNLFGAGGLLMINFLFIFHAAPRHSGEFFICRADAFFFIYYCLI